MPRNLRGSAGLSRAVPYGGGWGMRLSGIDSAGVQVANMSTLIIVDQRSGQADHCAGNC